ncbi:hypothetical protein Dimus_034223, partial [Dionaea muscipula]
GGIPKHDNIEIDDEGNMVYIEQDVTEVEADPSEMAIGPCSPASAAKDRMEIERLLGPSEVDATALATREQSLKEALQDTGLEEEPRVNIPSTGETEDPVDGDPKDGA